MIYLRMKTKIWKQLQFGIQQELLEKHSSTDPLSRAAFLFEKDGVFFNLLEKIEIYFL